MQALQPPGGFEAPAVYGGLSMSFRYVCMANLLPHHQLTRCLKLCNSATFTARHSVARSLFRCRVCAVLFRKTPTVLKYIKVRLVSASSRWPKFTRSAALQYRTRGLGCTRQLLEPSPTVLRARPVQEYAISTRRYSVRVG